MSQAGKARALHALHHSGELLVLVNVWDAVSARTVAAVPGCRALATASWSIAAAHGVPDGEAIGRDAMLAAVARVTGAVDLPVSADLEAGYGDAGETVAAALEAGAVGCNLEDALRPVDEHAAQVAAARAAGERAGVPLVINARTDVFLAMEPQPGRPTLCDELATDGRVELAIARGRAYLEAGADCVFVPGARDPADLRALVAGMGGLVSVLAAPGGPSLAELRELGVARASLGPGSLGIAMAALRDAAASLLAGGELPPDLAFRP